LLSWGHCPHCNGVTVVNMQASLQSRDLCHRCNIIVALVVMVLLPSSSWWHCPCHKGIIAIVDAQASLPLPQWCCCPHCKGAIANITWGLLSLLHWRCCPYHNDLFALLSPWHCQLCWHCHLLCAGIMALNVLALMPLSCWHCCPCCAGVAIVCWRGLTCHPRLSTC
jgi:hypothetical protein